MNGSEYNKMMLRKIFIYSIFVSTAHTQVDTKTAFSSPDILVPRASVSFGHVVGETEGSGDLQTSGNTCVVFARISTRA